MAATVTPVVALEPSPQNTASARLDLATPRAVSRGLALLGFDWRPTAGEAPDGPGMYAWVIGRGATTAEKLDRPIAYIGLGEGSGGVRARLRDELSQIGPDYVHLHGRAMLALDGEHVAATVTFDPHRDLSWLGEALYWCDPRTIDAVRAWVSSPRTDVLKRAETLAIRIAAHIGDCAPPVNSLFTSAWASKQPYFWAGVAAAGRLAGPAA